MRKAYLITCCLLLLLWQIFAVIINNDVIIPLPLAVISYFLNLFTTSKFYIAVIYTLKHVFSGFIVSLMVSLILALIGYEYKVVKNLFEPLNIISKTIPNISYIIICLIWFGSTKSVTIICFLILFPMFYSNFIFALDNMYQDIKDVDILYHESFIYKIFKHLLPYLVNNILSTSKTCLSLGFKVGVMAEILGQVRYGIGKQLYISKINLDMTGVFAYTIVIIIIGCLINLLFELIIHFYNKKEVYENGETKC